VLNPFRVLRKRKADIASAKESVKLSLPIRFVRSLYSKADWVRTKVEKLQSESARWHALFTALKVFKLPYRGMRAMGLSPQMAVVALLGTSVAGGVVVNETLLDGPSFRRGDAGVYLAPHDAPIFYTDQYNTLRVNLEDIAANEVSISNISLGTVPTGSTLPSGETSAILVGGLPSSSGFSETFIEVTWLILKRLKCDSFDLSNTEAHTLNILGNRSDGHSIGPNLGNPPRVTVIGGDATGNMISSNGNYDQLKIQATKSGVNGRVHKLILENIHSKGGPCKFSRIKADRIDVELNETGLGNGLSTKEFIISTSTVFKNLSNLENIEVTVTP
jgi:hypothetical protein